MTTLLERVVDAVEQSSLRGALVGLIPWRSSIAWLPSRSP